MIIQRNQNAYLFQTYRQCIRVIVVLTMLFWNSVSVFGTGTSDKVTIYAISYASDRTLNQPYYRVQQKKFFGRHQNE